MINRSKKHLFTIAIISALTLVGCSNTSKLIVPDGAQRVPINRDASTHGASIHQDLVVKYD